MAELTARERLQPSLLDRLSDDDREQTVESRDTRVLSMGDLRRAVLRDLGWLLNSTSLGSFHDLSGQPLAMRSVINFGLSDFAGKTASGLGPDELGRRIRQTIWDFEPRILRDSVRVVPVAPSGRLASPNQMTFEIHGELWGQPLPERLYLKTQLDLDAGQAWLLDVETRDVR